MIAKNGNLTTVYNERNSLWQSAAELVEEASIGVVRGADEYMFGEIWSVFGTATRTYVVDGQVPIVRVFDNEGVFLHDLGSSGQGPGEYLAPILVAADNAGRVFVYDNRGHRINVYGRNGEAIATWRVENPGCCAWRMFASGDGLLWMPLETWWNFEASYGVQGFDAQGNAVSHRRVPRIAYERTLLDPSGRGIEAVPFTPRYSWGVNGLGDVVAGASDQYRFEVHRLTGEVLVIERHWDPVPTHSEERDWHRRWCIANMRGLLGPDWSGAEITIPNFKPAFKHIVPAASGETWLVRDGPGYPVANCVRDLGPDNVADARDNPCWVSSQIVDAFGLDGRYLGEVNVPARLSLTQRELSINGDIVTGVVEDEKGTILVKRLRVAAPARRH